MDSLSQTKALSNTAIPGDRSWEPYIHFFESIPFLVETELFEKACIVDEDALDGSREIYYFISSERAESIRRLFYQKKCSHKVVAQWLRFSLDNQTDLFDNGFLDPAGESLAVFAKAQIDLFQGLYLHVEHFGELFGKPRESWLLWRYSSFYFDCEPLFSKIETNGKIAGKEEIRIQQYKEEEILKESLLSETKDLLLELMDPALDLLEYSNNPDLSPSVNKRVDQLGALKMTISALALSAARDNKRFEGYWDAYQRAVTRYHNKMRNDKRYQFMGIVNDEFVTGSQSRQINRTRNRQK